MQAYDGNVVGLALEEQHNQDEWAEHLLDFLGADAVGVAFVIELVHDCESEHSCTSKSGLRTTQLTTQFVSERDLVHETHGESELQKRHLLSAV